MTEKKLRNWEDFFDRKEEGCFLVVDLDYPLELHDKYNPFAMCPDHLDKRLDAHLWNRREYGIYYEGLRVAINQGLILKKIH